MECDDRMGGGAKAATAMKQGAPIVVLLWCGVVSFRITSCRYSILSTVMAHVS